MYHVNRSLEHVRNHDVEFIYTHTNTEYTETILEKESIPFHVRKYIVIPMTTGNQCK